MSVNAWSLPCAARIGNGPGNGLLVGRARVQIRQRRIHDHDVGGRLRTTARRNERDVIGVRARLHSGSFGRGQRQSGALTPRAPQGDRNDEARSGRTPEHASRLRTGRREPIARPTPRPRSRESAFRSLGPPDNFGDKKRTKVPLAVDDLPCLFCEVGLLNGVREAAAERFDRASQARRRHPREPAQTRHR